MFSIRNHRGVHIFRWMGLSHEFFYIPGPLRRIRRIIQRWIASNGQMLPAIVIWNRWRPNRDAICDVECFLWYGLLRSFWWNIFRPVNLPAEDPGVADWIRKTGLDFRVAGDVFLLQTHVTALLLGVPDANRAIRERTISRLHPMFFSEPESALEDIFLSHSGSLPHSICPLQLEISGCLFVLGNAFLTAWRNAWRRPRQFFFGSETRRAHVSCGGFGTSDPFWDCVLFS